LAFRARRAVTVITLTFLPLRTISILSLSLRARRPVTIPRVCRALLIALLWVLILVTAITVFIFLFGVITALIQTGKAILAHYVFVIGFFVFNKFIFQFG
jgi:hypothetical protein